jgi:SAM-dependent methyltransferase
MTLTAPRLRLEGGRVCHDVGTDGISNDLAGWIAEDLVASGLIAPLQFESVFVDAVLAVDPDPLTAWTAFYRNTLDALARGGDPGGTNAGMAPVHARAVELARGGHVVELGCCFGFLALRLAAAGHRVTAIDLVPDAARLLTAVAPRVLPAHPSRDAGFGISERPTRGTGMSDSQDGDVRLARRGCPTRGRVAAVAGDALAVPLGDGTADTVYAVHLLEHLPPAAAPRVLAEMLRVARRRVVVAVPFEDEPNPIWGHIRTFDLAALDALGAETGLGYTVTEHHGGWLVLDP